MRFRYPPRHQRLSPPLRRLLAIVLRREGFTLREIATALDVSVEQARKDTPVGVPKPQRPQERSKPPGRRTVRPFPLTPVERLVGADSVCALARRLGVSTNSVYRWRRHGIPWYSADSVAIRLDLHPVLLWPEWERMPA